jgi:hypothetical protein
LATPKGSVVSNLIDIDLREYEPEEEPHEEPEESASELVGARSANAAGVRRRSKVTLPHPPGPAGLMVPRTRLWIKRPPGPAGL